MERHLISLGPVYGVQLYVNGDDQHQGKMYKDIFGLRWEDCNHKHDFFDERGEKYPSFEMRRAFACWSFNKAVQTVKGLHEGETLRSLLDNNSGNIPPAQREEILSLMFRHRARHGIDVQVWQSKDRPEERYKFSNEELVDDLIALRLEISILDPYYPFAPHRKLLHICLLCQPIGNNFAFSLPSCRVQALKWLTHKIVNFKSNDDPKNFATFNLLEPRSAEMQLLFLSLRQRMLALPQHLVTFETFTNGALLVRVLQRRVPENGRPRLSGFNEEKWRAAFMVSEPYDFQRLEFLPLAF